MRGRSHYCASLLLAHVTVTSARAALAGDVTACGEAADAAQSLRDVRKLVEGRALANIEFVAGAALVVDGGARANGILEEGRW